jgi:hypothetical protein
MLKNRRGLRDLATHLHIAYCIHDHSLDFVAISETAEEISLKVYLIVYMAV